MSKIKNIVISGTNFWNPGDDFVRDGVIKILRNLFNGYQLNFHFYNFNQDFFPQDKFSGIHNMVSKGDLNQYRDFIDAVVIAGLSAGEEIKDLYNWIIENNLHDRVYMIGAGYENNYAAHYIKQEPELTIFKHARIITGRTAKTPSLIKELNLPYQHINCPAILSVDKIKPVEPGKKIEKVAFSIQLPHEIGVVNHAVNKKMYQLSIELLSELYDKYQIDVIVHHKSEYFHFLNLFKQYNIPINVIYSSFYQDLFDVYPNYDLVVTTRLHSSLFANGFGIPGIIINDTDRHTHCLAGFQHSHWVNSKEKFYEVFESIKAKPLEKIAEELNNFKQNLMTKYLTILREPFGIKDTQNEAVPPKEKKSLPEEQSLRKKLHSAIGGTDVKKRVLSIISSLEKDYWLEKNIERYQKAVNENESGNFDTVSFLNWYAHNLKPKTYLEVGVRRGRSMAQVLVESPQTQAVGIDLWIEDYSSIPEKGIFADNPGPDFVHEELKKYNVKNFPLLIKGDSHEILSSLWERGDIPKEFDLILVDGDHSYPGAKSDLDYCFDHLADGGALVFDDINHPSHKELKDLWSEYKTRFASYLFLEDNYGTGTGVAFKPPFDDYLTLLNDAFSTESLEAGSRLHRFDEPANELPIHFFTIVLNGQPFIEYHINVFKKLPFKWHWHIMEGVADLKHDTAWSLQKGGRIVDAIHSSGLSNDGTSEYLDKLQRQYPDNVTIYRKEKGKFWDGKLEMVNAPLKNVQEECILWQVDVDEFWRADQIYKVRDLFLTYPEKTAAYYYSNYFVGERLVTTSINTYGNYTDFEWLRTWRLKPGDKWVSHEPPKLCRRNESGEWIDLSSINAVKHNETKLYGLTFQHFAYVIDKQLQFKEHYYGYKNAVGQWKNLQRVSEFPVYLKNYFEWVNDDAVVETSASQNIQPLLYKDESGKWQFELEDEFSYEWNRILFVRTDSIGDNVLASSMIPHIKAAHPASYLAVVCQPHIAELYENNPFVDEIITIDKQKFYQDENYKIERMATLRSFKADAALNSVYSREPITDLITLACGAAETIAINGDLCNTTLELKSDADKNYSLLIESDRFNKNELDHHKDFLNAIGIEAKQLLPMLWLKQSDEKFAEDFYKLKNLAKRNTITLFPFPQDPIKLYDDFASVIRGLHEYNFIILGGKGFEEEAQKLADTDTKRCFNLTGKTTVMQTAALIKLSCLNIGVDSAGGHIASALNVPNLVVLGGGHFGRFYPYSKLTSVVCLPLDCYGCNWQCRYEKAHCILEIKSSVILEAVKQTLMMEKDKPAVFVQGYEDTGKNPGWKWFDKFLDPNSVQLVPLGWVPDMLYGEERIHDAEESIMNGSYAEAKKVLNEILNDNPENKDALNNLAVVDILEKNFDSAAKRLNSILSIYPDDNVAKENLNYLNEQKAIHEVIKQSERLIENGNYRPARKLLDEVFISDENNLDALNNLAVIEISENNYQEALAIYNRVIQIDPQNEVALNNLNYLNELLNQVQEKLV